MASLRDFKAYSQRVVHSEPKSGSLLIVLLLNRVNRVSHSNDFKEWFTLGQRVVHS